MLMYCDILMASLIAIIMYIYLGILLIYLGVLNLSTYLYDQLSRKCE